MCRIYNFLMLIVPLLPNHAVVVVVVVRLGACITIG